MSDALDFLSALVLENGRRFGEQATPCQWADARAVLDPESRTPLHYLTRSRGYSKTTDLAAFLLAAMLTQLPPTSRCYAYAVDESQAGLLLDSIAGFVARTPQLRDAVELFELKARVVATGTTLEAQASDAASAFGKRPAFVVVDELAEWPSGRKQRKLWEAITTAIPKTPGARLAVITTAGDPVHWSKEVLEHAKASPAWHVREVSGPAPWIAQRDLEEQRALHTENTYRRLFLNEWVASEDRLADPGDIAECVTLGGPLAPDPRLRYVIGLDLAHRRDNAVACVCHGETLRDSGGREIGQRVLVDRIQVWSPGRLRSIDLQEVQEWVAFTAREYGGAVVRFDPYQAIQMTQHLRRHGLRCEEFTASAASNAKLVSVLFTLIGNRLLALPPDADLTEELSSVRVRETTAGTLRIDHDAGRHDDRVIALALAASHIVEKPIARPLRTSSAFRSRPSRSRPPTTARAARAWAASREKRRLEELAPVESAPEAPRRRRGRRPGVWYPGMR